MQRHLDQLAEYDQQVPRGALPGREPAALRPLARTQVRQPAQRGQPGHAGQAAQAGHRGGTSQPSHTGGGTATQTRAPARPQNRESVLFKKPETKNKTTVEMVLDMANSAIGNDKEFRKKKGAVVDVQMGIFWLAVGAVVAAIVAGVVYGMLF